MAQEPETVFELVRCPMVAVIGPTEATTDQMRIARRVGRLLAAAGVIVVTGGRDGIMSAACHGAQQAGGMTIGILPGRNAAESPPNRFVQIPIYTGLGEARNAIIGRTAGAIIAIGGRFGTLSEIAFAMLSGRPVILMDSWDLSPPAPIPEMAGLLRQARSPQEAVSLAVALAGSADASPESGERGPAVTAEGEGEALDGAAPLTVPGAGETTLGESQPT